ncbi:YhcN/YlaJ family sporulation lipoprotein [Paenibacillus soyae]|uniref:YhcN/YlaJ family sporulation lipoprotein n=1 Tax=Paenibacillus soyae TaxID=2969249 RepID=A0A9X2MQ29_9BACL|nr:YhcN/YlaJ family sporulation lipoprotein [Paenibacillus soyae]MCR2804345.1 YhcN/YlaJ family sporulation lipoprotein [Paenibacillus soyae]
MRKKLAALSAGVLIGTLLSGCSEYQGDIGNKNIRTNNAEYNSFGVIRDKRFADDGKNEQNRVRGSQQNNNNVIGSHRNYRLEMSEEIADRIKEITSVKASYVMLADKKAYVAVSLHDHAPQGETKAMSRTHLGLFGKNGAEDGRRISSMSTGEELLTADMKSQIAEAVKELHPQIANIYISANPEFVGRMNMYMNDNMLGYPVQNYIMEFNAMAERVFPVGAPDSTGDGILKSTSVNRKHRLLD